ncbi:MAG: glycosyltransferase family 2 protein [Cyanobacteria bacterium RM1_2_2]|nr:glycosyltransferase family 2 protein [Cyanobacteria bacterium RM1_2_2]
MSLCVPDVDRILAIIPVHNEAETIAGVVQSLRLHGLRQIRVVDNGSTDQSAAAAKTAGAEVVSEPKLGYGQACWRGLQNLPSCVEWILFCDGDGSDDLTALPQFFAACSTSDLILGNRRATAKSRSALTPVQNFGNGFAASLIQAGWGYRYHDLGPLRLIRRSALERIQMQDRGFGWTVEMQARAVELNLRICELSVNYLPRQGGTSKISGTLSGSIRAGVVILQVIGQLYWRRWRGGKPAVLLCSALLLLLGCIWLTPHGDFRQVAVFSGFWIGVSLICGGFALSWMIRSIDAIWFWGVSILSRLILLPMYPGDDIWRYLWEGYIQTLGFSPYQFAPNAPELIPYRTEWWSLINHLDVSAIYPPLTQLGFRLLAFISPTVLLFKLAFVCADLLTCWLLSRKFGHQATLLYAWNPLILYSFAGGGHYDSWFILPLVAAWLSFDSIRLGSSFNGAVRLKSGLLLGISIALKWMSLPILGFILWQAIRHVRIKQVVIIGLLGCLPFGISALFFCHSGLCTLIPTESVFVSYGRSADFIPYLVSLVWQPSLQANWIYGIPLGFAVLFLLWRSKNFLQFSESYLFILLLLSPIIHAWYFTWIIPFAVASRNLGTCLLSISAFIYFVLPYRLAAGNSDWLLSPWERGVLWLPLLLGWAWSATNWSAMKIKRESML